MTSLMAPRVRVVGFYVRSDGEVVADTVALNVEGVFENQVTIMLKCQTCHV